MKIKFVKGHKPKGHAEDIPDYKMGEVYDFNGPVAEGYARKYIERGYAVAHKDEFVARVPVQGDHEREISNPVGGGIKVDAVKDFRRPRK
jgi:hypothetical protein